MKFKKKIITIKRLRIKFDIINKKQDIFFSTFKKCFPTKIKIKKTLS